MLIILLLIFPSLMASPAFADSKRAEYWEDDVGEELLLSKPLIPRSILKGRYPLKSTSSKPPSSKPTPIEESFYSISPDGRAPTKLSFRGPLEPRLMTTEEQIEVYNAFAKASPERKRIIFMEAWAQAASYGQKGVDILEAQPHKGKGYMPIPLLKKHFSELSKAMPSSAKKGPVTPYTVTKSIIDLWRAITDVAYQRAADDPSKSTRPLEYAKRILRWTHGELSFNVLEPLYSSSLRMFWCFFAQCHETWEVAERSIGLMEKLKYPIRERIKKVNILKGDETSDWTRALYFWVKYNQMGYTPDEIAHGLRLLKNVIPVHPALITLSQSEVLALRGVKGVVLSPQLAMLEKLKTVSLVECQLIAPLSEVASAFPQVTSLALTGCDIVDMTFATGMPKLQSLDLSHNKIMRIPSAIKNLRELKRLGLANNKIYEMPKEIGWLQKLETLDLSANSLMKVSEEVWRLQKLMFFSLSRNHLTSLPESMFPSGIKPAFFRKISLGVMGGMKSLEYMPLLVLRGNPLDADTVSRVKEAYGRGGVLGPSESISSISEEEKRRLLEKEKNLALRELSVYFREVTVAMTTLIRDSGIEKPSKPRLKPASPAVAIPKEEKEKSDEGVGGLSPRELYNTLMEKDDGAYIYIPGD